MTHNQTLRLAFVLPVALAFALACGGGSTEAPPPPPAPPAPPAAPADVTPAAPADATPAAATPVATAPPAAVTKTFDQASFVCCDNDRASRVLRKYLEIETRLVKGTESGISGQYTGLRGEAKGAIELGGFGAEQNVILKRIVDGAEASNKQDLAGKRKSFKSLSADVNLFLQMHSGKGETKVAEAFCPMFEGGASWLQTEATIANPYYGSEMLTCGSFK